MVAELWQYIMSTSDELLARLVNLENEAVHARQRQGSAEQALAAVQQRIQQLSSGGSAVWSYLQWIRARRGPGFEGGKISSHSRICAHGGVGTFAAASVFVPSRVCRFSRVGTYNVDVSNSLMQKCPLGSEIVACARKNNFFFKK